MNTERQDQTMSKPLLVIFFIFSRLLHAKISAALKNSQSSGYIRMVWHTPDDGKQTLIRERVRKSNTTMTKSRKEVI